MARATVPIAVFMLKVAKVAAVFPAVLSLFFRRAPPQPRRK
jgi:hypothetical protein